MQSYTHFTLTERENLRIMLNEGKSIRQIASTLGRNPSSVSRELSRNKTKNGYNAWYSTSMYIYRRKKSKKNKRFEVDKELINFVKDCLFKYWSPEIITAKWKQAHANAKLSHCTIYRALKQKLLPGYSAETYLRRRNRLKFKKGNNQTIRPEHVIADRPAQANKRERIGDWEGDTVYGKKGYLVTCVDRKSRFLVAAIAKNKTASTVNEAILKALYAKRVNTLTLDRGSEFAGFKQFQKILETTVYFADPHSPWQRGSNENINGLLRFFFPRGTDFCTISQDILDYIVELINTRPRKCLGWLSPKDVFFNKCCT